MAVKREGERGGVVSIKEEDKDQDVGI